MSIGRVVGLVVLLVVLYAVITQPRTSAAMTRDGANSLIDAGGQVTLFLASLVGGSESSSSSSSSGSDSSDSGTTRRYPAGGVATGDGSYPG